MSPASSAQRWRTWLIVALAAALVVTATGWALAVVLRPADDPLDATGGTFVTVEQGEIGSSITLNTVAEWTPEPVGVNQAPGVVTGIRVAAGDEVSQGSVLYTVNLRPVAVAAGEVPAFRPIAQGVKGDDVRQLQQLLADLGLYRGAVNGDAGVSTAQAIRAWQKRLGVDQTGEVALGDVIFVPRLPTRVSLDTEHISRGVALAGGESVVRALPHAPTFTIPATDSQAAMMPTGTRVEITSPEGAVWSARVAGQVREAETQTMNVQLAGEGDAPICADQCEQVPVTGQSLLSTRIVVVEQTAGLVVPSAALVTGADGVITLVDETGARLPVTVVASAKGTSIVEGVEAGTRVRVPGETTP